MEKWRYKKGEEVKGDVWHKDSRSSKCVTCCVPVSCWRTASLSKQWEAKLEVDTETVDDHREDSRTWREQLKEEKDKKKIYVWENINNTFLKYKITVCNPYLYCTLQKNAE